MTTLDDNILQFHGGSDINSLRNIIQFNNDDDDEGNPLQIIKHSSYYHDDKFKSIIDQHKGNFCILSTNIQSINAKFDELFAYINDLRQHNFEFSAICIQESWMSETEDTSPVDIPGYNCIHKGKTCSNNGGLIIYLLKNFDYEVITDYDNTVAFEKQFIKVSGKFITKPIILGNLYRQP